MQIVNLYRYRGEGGAIDTTILLEAPYELRKRLTADDGMVLTDGEALVKVIDIDIGDLDKWAEIPEPEEVEGGEADGSSDID